MKEKQYIVTSFTINDEKRYVLYKNKNTSLYQFV